MPFLINHDKYKVDIKLVKACFIISNLILYLQEQESITSLRLLTSGKI